MKRYSLPIAICLALLFVSTLVGQPDWLDQDDFGEEQSIFQQHSDSEYEDPPEGLSAGRLTTITAFLGVDGSKQPQDFGTNANLGINSAVNLSGVLFQDLGIGFQLGTRVTFSGNAVQVFELLGESKDRFQNFSTVGVFQRLENGINYGVAYDFLTQESFDNFSLGQWRARLSYQLSPSIEVGTTINLASQSDLGQFNATVVELDPIEQIHFFIRKQWKTGVNTTAWMGVANEHSEENAVTGTLPVKENTELFGAKVFAPLNQHVAIYGETNLIMPADTGAVDAFLGMQFSPGGIRRTRSTRNRFRPLFSVASSPTFTTDLTRR